MFAFLTVSALAEGPALQSSAELGFKHPEFLEAGRCVVYQEGGTGWVVTEPVYYLKGRVLGGEMRMRHVGKCPSVAGKQIRQYSREEFIRHALAYPCVSENGVERDEPAGSVRLRVTDWEPPPARTGETHGGVYRGMFIDRKLEKDMEIELDADLLGACQE